VTIQVIKACIDVMMIAYFNSIVTTSSSRKLFLLARSALCFGPKQTNEMDKGPLIENSSYLNEFSIRFSLWRLTYSDRGSGVGKSSRSMTSVGAGSSLSDSVSVLM
jgi:hypothetical protein